MAFQSNPDYAPMYSSHGHQRKTHIANTDGSLCGIEKRFDYLLWTTGVDYYDIESQFFIDADGNGCLRCGSLYRKLSSKKLKGK